MCIPPLFPSLGRASVFVDNLVSKPFLFHPSLLSNLVLIHDLSFTEDSQAASISEAQTYAQENGLLFMETSAKTATNFKEIFYEIVLNSVIPYFSFGRLQQEGYRGNYGDIEMDALKREIETLKPKMKNMFMSSQGTERILMIYLLVSLGLAYHFEDEIYDTLKESFTKIEEMMDNEEDLYTVSIHFWVFRTYSHHISSDVFTRFKESNGDFKETLKEDPRGGTCPPHLSMHIQNALYLSQRWNMEMLVGVKYISFYEQEEDHDKMLLRFAKISFKLLQLQYIQDLKILTKYVTYLLI
ncbi:hypothetical protein Bca4012_007376 [Brassica carinata]